MARLTTVAVLAALLAGSAFAQGAPEAEWGTYPGLPAPPLPPSPPPPPPPPRTPLPAPARPYPYAWPAPAPNIMARPSTPPRPPEDPNVVSMFGAPTLGQWKRGQSFVLGFPLLQLRLALGLADWFDLALGFDSFYGTMNEPRLALKLGGLKGGGWTFSGALEGGWAFFTTRASREVRGARWITGRRNGNASAAVLLSWQGTHARAARLFVEGRYSLAFDTEPFATDPLSGVPPAVILGHNGTARVGAELPLSKTTSFVFLLGLDFHGRDVDASVMPACSVGLVTGL